MGIEDAIRDMARKVSLAGRAPSAKGHTAEVDDHGVVTIRDAQGNPLMWLAESDYLKLRAQDEKAEGGK